MIRSFRKWPHLCLLPLILAMGCSTASNVATPSAEITDVPDDIEPTHEATQEEPPQPEIAAPPMLVLITTDGDVAGEQGSYCWTPDDGSPGLCRDNLWPAELPLAGSFARDETLSFRFEETPAESIFFDMYPIEQLAQGPSESGGYDALSAVVEDGEAVWPIITVPGDYLLIALASWANGDDSIYFFHIEVPFDEEAERALPRSPSSIIAPQIGLVVDGAFVGGQMVASCWPLMMGRGGSSPPPFCYEQEADAITDYMTIPSAGITVRLESGTDVPDEVMLSLAMDAGADPLASDSLSFESSAEGEYEVLWVPGASSGDYLLTAEAHWADYGSSTTVFGVSLP